LKLLSNFKVGGEMPKPSSSRSQSLSQSKERDRARWTDELITSLVDAIYDLVVVKAETSVNSLKTTHWTKIMRHMQVSYGDTSLPVDKEQAQSKLSDLKKDILTALK
jgi:hypothetical protein